MSLISPEDWDNIEQVIYQAHESFNKDIITWRRFTMLMDRFGEDDSSGEHTDIELEVLVAPNNYRTWPLTKHTETGEIDKQSAVFLFNLQYIKNLDISLGAGEIYDAVLQRLKYDPSADRFFFRGIKYKAGGDTLVSQIGNRFLFLQIIMKREDLATGETPYNVTP